MHAKAVIPFSVLLSVYARESPAHLNTCLDSLESQTMPAFEIVIVKDGPIGRELEQVIDCFRKTLPIKELCLKENGGLGTALRHGVEHCSCEWIARMDSDDICIPDRFEKQFAYLEAHPKIDVLGTYIAEFSDVPAILEGTRSLPLDPEVLLKFARQRNPLNHMTVVFRRSAVLASGNYLPLSGFEDYYLWARMIQKGFMLANMEDILVHVRAGNAMYRRRGGLNYIGDELKFQSLLWKIGFISNAQFASNLMIRIPVRLVPWPMRKLVYKAALRHQVPTTTACGSSLAPANRVAFLPEKLRVYTLTKTLAETQEAEDPSLIEP